MKCDRCGTEMKEWGGVTMMETQRYMCPKCKRMAEEPYAGNTEFYGGNK
jgi:transposase-like protein